MLHSKHIYVIGYPFLSDSYKTKKTQCEYTWLYWKKIYDTENDKTYASFNLT